MTLKSMKGLFLVFGVGLCLVSGSAYAVSPKAILEYLLGYGEDFSSRFKQLFNSISQEAETAKEEGLPDPRRLVGEADGQITLPKEKDLGEQYPGCWHPQYYFKGDFFCNIEGFSVFEAKDIDVLLSEQRFRREQRLNSGAMCVNLANVFKTLMSEVFMKALLSEELVQDFYERSNNEVRTSVCVSFVRKDLLGKSAPTKVSFQLMYRSIPKNPEATSKLMIGFDIPYDLENNRFTDDPLTVLMFHLETYRIVANVGRPEISKNGKTKVRFIPKVGKALTNEHLVKALKSGIECGDVNVYIGEADRRTPKEDGLEEEDDVSFCAGNLHISPKVKNRYLLTNGHLKSVCGIRWLSLQRKKITTEKRPIATEKQPKSCRSGKSVPLRKPKKQNNVVVL